MTDEASTLRCGAVVMRIRPGAEHPQVCAEPVRQREGGPCSYVYDDGVKCLHLKMQAQHVSKVFPDVHEYDPGYEHIDPSGDCATCGTPVAAIVDSSQPHAQPFSTDPLHDYIAPVVEREHEAVAVR